MTVNNIRMSSLAAAIIVAASMTLTAPAASAQRLTNDEVQRSLTELRNFKHRVMVRELDLTKDQQKKFFEIYDAMDGELMDVGTDVRERERRALSNTRATDAETLEAARAMFDQRRREGDIEARYFDRLAAILTPRQLLKLKGVERKIAMDMARYHGRHKARKKD